MADPRAPRQSSDLNYFVCTLDQAARVKNAYSPKWPTVNDFIDQRAITSPTLPAFGFPVPLKDQEENPTEWGFAVHCEFLPAPQIEHQADPQVQHSMV